MIVPINWQAVAWLTTIALAWTTFLVGIIRWLLIRETKHNEARITAAEVEAKKATAALTVHREEYLKFLGTLPLDYYRREDMIRFETMTHAKLDALAGFIRQLECHKCQVKPH